MSVHWSPHWHEDIPPGEDARWEAFAQQIAKIARDVSVRTGRPVDRVFHVKQHTGVRGTLRVLPGLPTPLASGVFATPQAWPCYVRFSNGAVRKQLDGILDVRGFSLKLVGVPGPKLLGGSDVTQDFLFVQTPAVPTDSPEEFLALARASIGGPLFIPLKLAASIGVVRAAALLLRLAMVKQPITLAGAEMFTAVPVKLGPAAAKLSLVPDERPVLRQGLTLRDDIVTRLRGGPLRWRLRAQLYIDDRRTPIESASQVWRERDAAFHDVAVLEVPQQDIESAAGRALDDAVSRMGFDPWHGIEDHRPLGATQRARRAAYRDSRAQRGTSPEPTG
jgi:hypothetical protein